MTDEGIEGLGYITNPGYGIDAIHSVIVNELEPLLIGENPLFAEKLWQKMWQRTHYYGRKGIAILAMAAIDIALWDIIGKRANKPLYELLGPFSHSVSVYASGGWMAYTVKELVKEMAGYAEQGYTRVKMKIGHQDYKIDLNRIKAVREALGDKVTIMVDANQFWKPKEAVEIGQRLGEYNIDWFEEPVAADDVKGNAYVRKSLNLKLATGENEYTIHGFKDLIQSEAVDVVQPDLFRVGGISQWKKVANISEAWNLLVSSHSHMEVQFHLMASISNGVGLENHMLLRDCMEQVFIDLPQVKNGVMYAPTLPGVGLVLSETAIEKYSK